MLLSVNMRLPQECQGLGLEAHGQSASGADKQLGTAIRHGTGADSSFRYCYSGTLVTWSWGRGCLGNGRRNSPRQMHCVLTLGTTQLETAEHELYSSPGAAAAKAPWNEWLKTTGVYLPPSWGPDVWGQGVPGLRSLQRLQGRVLPASSSFWGLQASLGLWPPPSRLCLCLPGASPLCLCLSSSVS